jgi:hypothetical protein
MAPVFRPGRSWIDQESPSLLALRALLHQPELENITGNGNFSESCQSLLIYCSENDEMKDNYLISSSLHFKQIKCLLLNINFLDGDGILWTKAISELSKGMSL